MTTPAVALGKFDALHLGHRALAEHGGRAAAAVSLLSFTGMAEILGWEPRQPLVAGGDRARIVRSWQDALGCPIVERSLPFNLVRELTGESFLRLLQARLATEVVVVGEDFRGGRDRSVGVVELAGLCTARGMRLVVVPPVLVGGRTVSSSGLREALGRGDMAGLMQGLGRPYRLLGTVLRGDGRGRSLGVPTANCGARQNQDPAPGVYAGFALIAAGRFPAAINVGRQPTVGENRPLAVEAHLLGYQGDCYDQPLALDLIGRLRPEQRFGSLAELTAQIHDDIRRTRQVTAAHDVSGAAAG